ncbi:hypothetical protein [Nocardia sp. NPDC052566]|uniref:WXG100-like domain-containing protein n=1 Tax=Nocardia sp. NPDC052566 TaxID=3364330 RepID=UPI0037CB11D6
MSIYMPDELQWLGWVAGSAWPKGDEDTMWGIRDDWNEASRALRALLADLDVAADATLAAYPGGDGVEQMRDALHKLTAGDQSVAHLAELLGSVGESADALATEIEYTKLLVITSLVMLLIEIAMAWLFPPTAAAAEAAAVAATRGTMRLIAGRMATAIERVITKLAGPTVARFIVRKFMPQAFRSAAVSAGLGAGQDLAIQVGQNIAGHRTGVDWKRVGITAATGAAGGVVGGFAGSGLNKFGTWAIGKAPASWRLMPTVVGRSSWQSVAVHTGKGIVVGAGAGVAGALTSWTVGAAITGGPVFPVDPMALVSGASMGALTGGSKGFRDTFRKLPTAGQFTAPGAGRVAARTFGDGSAPIRTNTPSHASGEGAGTQHSTSVGNGGTGVGTSGRTPADGRGAGQTSTSSADRDQPSSRAPVSSHSQATSATGNDSHQSGGAGTNRDVVASSRPDRATASGSSNSAGSQHIGGASQHGAADSRASGGGHGQAGGHSQDGRSQPSGASGVGPSAGGHVAAGSSGSNSGAAAPVQHAAASSGGSVTSSSGPDVGAARGGSSGTVGEARPTAGDVRSQSATSATTSGPRPGAGAAQTGPGGDGHQPAAHVGASEGPVRQDISSAHGSDARSSGSTGSESGSFHTAEGSLSDSGTYATAPDTMSGQPGAAATTPGGRSQTSWSSSVDGGWSTPNTPASQSGSAGQGHAPAATSPAATPQAPPKRPLREPTSELPYTPRYFGVPPIDTYEAPAPPEMWSPAPQPDPRPEPPKPVPPQPEPPQPVPPRPEPPQPVPPRPEPPKPAPPRPEPPKPVSPHPHPHPPADPCRPVPPAEPDPCPPDPPSRPDPAVPPRAS